MNHIPPHQGLHAATRLCSRRSLNGSTIILPRREYSQRARRDFSPLDPRLEDLGKVIKDEYAVIREHYGWFHYSSSVKTTA